MILRKMESFERKEGEELIWHSVSVPTYSHEPIHIKPFSVFFFFRTYLYKTIFSLFFFSLVITPSPTVITPSLTGLIDIYSILDYLCMFVF